MFLLGDLRNFVVKEGMFGFSCDMSKGCPILLSLMCIEHAESVRALMVPPGFRTTYFDFDSVMVPFFCYNRKNGGNKFIDVVWTFENGGNGLDVFHAAVKEEGFF